VLLNGGVAHGIHHFGTAADIMAVISRQVPFGIFFVLKVLFADFEKNESAIRITLPLEKIFSINDDARHV